MSPKKSHPHARSGDSRSNTDFDQIPINRPQSPVNDNHRDGFAQIRVPDGRTPYLPNTVGGGCPFLADQANGGYEHVARPVAGVKTRERAETDNFVQATAFYRSLTPVERDHVVNAFRFELGKVDVAGVVARMLGVLANIDTELCELVAAGLGLETPPGSPPQSVQTSAALSMVRHVSFPPHGRVVHILAGDGCDIEGIRTLCAALTDASVTAHVIAPHKGLIRGADADAAVAVDRTFLTASSVEAKRRDSGQRCKCAARRRRRPHVDLDKLPSPQTH